MRVIERDIVGALIFSADGKLLLGHNHKGGAYQEYLVIPGGGIEEGETLEAALRREMYEEVGIDITKGTLERIEGFSEGKSEKTLQDTGERVVMKMKFHDFKVFLPQKASEITLKFDDDFADARWYTPQELATENIGPVLKRTLQKINFI